MTATILENDTDILESLDFEFAPPCENVHGCDNTAEWTLTVACCGYMRLVCQKCVDELLAWHRAASKVPNYGIRCKLCDHITPVGKYIHSIERI